MLVRDVKRLALFVAPAVLLLILCFRFLTAPDLLSRVGDWTDHTFAYNTKPGDVNNDHDIQQQPSPPPSQQAQWPPAQQEPDAGGSPEPPAAPEPFKYPSNQDRTYHEIFSASRADGSYFKIDFGPGEANAIMNPNIIPHPTSAGVWIVVAQQFQTGEPGLFSELVCNAVFATDDDGNAPLRCAFPATALPVEHTTGDGCLGEHAFLGMGRGPHDARVFLGPRAPYVVYGSNSGFTCFGQFVQDFRRLVEWKEEDEVEESSQVESVTALTSEGEKEAVAFAKGIEMQRPLPWHEMEKNWFLFWDRNGDRYVHYDVFPQRGFAKLAEDGAVGPDLAAPTAEVDERCLKTFLPSLPPQLESIHQATNSLAITMCRRADPGCKADEANTFLFTVIQHKTYYQFHGEYNPYVVLFRQEEPFVLHAVSKKPIWIHGREKMPNGLTNMLYVVSMSWKTKGQRYHGFLDDVLFLAFGIEDSQAGGIDVLASDLLEELGLCAQA